MADGDERIGSKRGRDEKESDIGVGRLEKRPSGIVLMEEYSYSYSGDEIICGVKYEEEKETTPSPSPSASASAGSLLNQLISSFVSSPRSDQHESENKITDDKDKDGQGDDIVAHLPRTLSEDAAPATDEASILIHSIIHD